MNAAFEAGWNTRYSDPGAAKTYDVDDRPPCGVTAARFSRSAYSRV